jgi:hypothetical protein
VEEVLIKGIYCVQPEFMTVITVQLPQMMQLPMTRGTHFFKAATDFTVPYLKGQSNLQLT